MASPSGYAPNAFATGAAGAPKQMAYATGLRNYTPQQGGYASHAFGGSLAPTSGQQAAHLSQAPPLDQYLMQAYSQVAADPQAAQYEQQVPGDINRLWRLSPTSPIFQPGYQHNPYVTQKAGELKTAAAKDSFASTNVGTWADDALLQQGAQYGLVPYYDNQGLVAGWQPFVEPNVVNN